MLMAICKGFITVESGVNIIGDTTVNAILSAADNGMVTPHAAMTKTGTITGKQYYIYQQGGLTRKSNLPATTLAGTDDKTNGAFAG